MQQKLTAGLLAVAFLLLAPGPGGSQVFSGDEAKDRVRELTGGIHWYHSLTQAQQAARNGEKMIFWVQMLGSLDGTT